MRISPSGAIVASTPGSGLPTVPMRIVRRRVHRDHGRRLRESVALENDEPRGVEELVDLRRERRTAGDEIASRPPVRACSFENTSLCAMRVLQREQSARRAAGELHVGPAFADAARPEEDPLLQRAARERVLEHARVHLLVQTRHGEHERRPHLDQILRHRVDRFGVRDARAEVEHQVVAAHPLEAVRQRQKAEAGVVAANSESPRTPRSCSSRCCRASASRPSARPSCPTCR